MVVVKPNGKPTAEPQYEVNLDVKLSPEELAAFQLQHEHYERNWEWLQAHVEEAYGHPHTYLCVAGQELFVGDDVRELIVRAKAAHPEDTGILTHINPKDGRPRIYAHRRQVEPG